MIQHLPRLVFCGARGAHTISFGKGVNYFPSLSKHGRPSTISQARHKLSLASVCSSLCQHQSMIHSTQCKDAKFALSTNGESL